MNLKSTTILAIETSCDETAASVICNGQILSDVVSSQIDIHVRYGGVVPEIASRNHLLKLPEVIDGAVAASGRSLTEMDAIAVTCGPGLVGALLTGVSYAKGLAFSLGKPLLGVNHLEGHIAANYLTGTKPPFIALLVSGGHTALIRVTDYGQYNILGSTKDDAAGEAFDKVARAVGLGYPGGPKIDQAAVNGCDTAIPLPHVTLGKDSLDFSFSGLKSAVLNYLNHAKMKNLSVNVHDLAASFRKSVVDVLVEKTIRAAVQEQINTIAVCGGVACNDLLRSELAKAAAANGLNCQIPPKAVCTDNGSMIACAAYYQYLRGDFAGLDLNAQPSLKF